MNDLVMNAIAHSRIDDLRRLAAEARRRAPTNDGSVTAAHVGARKPLRRYRHLGRLRRAST